MFFSFSSLVFFSFFFLINLFNYHTLMTRPYSQTHIQGSWVWCCSQTHLNLSNVSLILLLILIILFLDQALQLDLKLFGISLQKDLTLLDLSLFDIFDAKKKITITLRVCLYFFSFFFIYFFLSLLLWTAQCNPQWKSWCL
jgi:hypothetical protein